MNAHAPTCRARAFWLATSVALFDAATKLAAHELLPGIPSAGAAGAFRLAGPFALARVSNAGSALGFAQGTPIWIAIAIAGLIVALRLAKGGDVSGALLLAGAAANACERLLTGGVTDFFLIGTGARGVALNVADVALLAGAVLVTRSTLAGQPAAPAHSKSVSSGGACSRNDS